MFNLIRNQLKTLEAYCRGIVNGTLGIKTSAYGTKSSLSSNGLNPRAPVLKEWDKGVFGSELQRLQIYPRPLESTDGDYTSPGEGIDPLPSGTFHGTKKAATEIYHRIEQRFSSYFDLTGLEPTIPQHILFKDKDKMFTFQAPGSDNFPPHLNLVPNIAESAVSFLEIFNFMRLLDTGLLLPRIIPNKILDFIEGDPTQNTMAAIEKRNHEIRIAKKNIGQEPNIGDRADWYTDVVFAQQFFTGPNPTTITRASASWVEQFQNQAKAQNNNSMLDVLKANTASLYVQDYSYFRQAVGASPDATFKSDDGARFGCASVCLFNLNTDGKLHPLAIVIDYKGSMEKSVVIFNKRLSAADSSASEAADWPWRYAKLCVQVSDWSTHELTIHLTQTHLVEEVVIVAAHRKIPQDHIVYRLLEPHWLKTLPLNAAARASLVPGFIVYINGMTTAQTYAFVGDAYKNFDFKGRYIPNDLTSRGFPLTEMNSKKYHNYAYGKNMLSLWNSLRTFVAAALKAKYPTDADVLNDGYIQAFSAEMRNPLGGAMDKFPELKTVDDLIDMIVMCIHIASPQHTAVNYLQDYYQAFVPNKLGCLCAPLPDSLTELSSFKETNMIQALPTTTEQARIWLMSSHLPYLLSYRVAEDQTLMNYAISLQKLAGAIPGDPVGPAAEGLVDDLIRLKTEFQRTSDGMDDQTLPYHVMDPGVTAISILL